MHGRAPPLLNDEPASGLSARVRPAKRQVVNLVENRVMRVLGKVEAGERFLALAVYQGNPSKDVTSYETEADPIVAATSWDKRRFFLFSRREPESSGDAGGRDVLNEKPLNEFAMPTGQQVPPQRVHDLVVLRQLLYGVIRTLPLLGFVVVERVSLSRRRPRTSARAR